MNRPSARRRQTPIRPAAAPSGWRAYGARQLGAGLITGAADDDPSGIATYSQAGARFGYAMLWTMPLTLPLMVAIQLVSARIGYVTRRGLTANIKRTFPPAVLWSVVGMLVVANTLNLAADIAAMAQALRLVAGGSAGVYAVAFGAFCLALQVFMRYRVYVRWLKWLTLSLLAYVAVVFTVRLDWQALARASFAPELALNHDALLMIVAVCGTTISPYLFFWQAALEMESGQDGVSRSHAEVRQQLRRIRTDTVVGMSFSNLIGFCIILSAAATLHAAGVGDIQTSAQAAEALRPLAGDFCFLLFSLGIIGTGLLAVPVLAGSAAYAVAEAAGWPGSLDARLVIGEGRAFYAVIAAATVGGVALCFTPIDPVKGLFWAAVLNGVIALPIMAVMMRLASHKDTMGPHVIGPRLRRAGWFATGAMAIVVIAMLVTLPMTG